MDSYAGFVEYYAPCSQVCPVFGQFPSTARVQATTRLLLHCCHHFFIYHLINSFPSSSRLHSKRTCLLEFLRIIFSRLWAVIGPTPFFMPLSVRNFCRAIGAQLLFL
ncbi:hypothetical protein TNCV_2627371 [Trichonephila clavipes]|uniref:Uncharacterized protein n=1 Tax=Trichonephila clavipes TaxID=2585209 RepID=A0A8X7BGJ8_TRICX|nr:hypothetical protein TNCV_2627371 [Trichonephila clavipes]